MEIVRGTPQFLSTINMICPAHHIRFAFRSSWYVSPLCKRYSERIFQRESDVPQKGPGAPCISEGIGRIRLTPTNDQTQNPHPKKRAVSRWYNIFQSRCDMHT